MKFLFLILAVARYVTEATVVAADSVPGRASLAPVVFLPGFGGCELFATVSDEKYLPKECENSGIQIGEKFRVAYNVRFDAQYSSCALALLEMNFDANAQPKFYDREGITISTADHDGISGVAPIYWGFFSVLKSWGYTIDVNAFGANYDYRYSSRDTLRKIGFIDSLKALIERAYKLNNSQHKVYLMGHSNGGPTMYAFLQEMTAEWKETYLKGMISLSGNMLGQMNCISTFVYSDPQVADLMEISNSWEASFSSISYGGYAGLDAYTTLVTTYEGTEHETQYSPKLEDIQALFQSANRSDWSDKFSAVYPTMDRQAAPESVDVYCLYGAELPTTYSFTFSGAIASGEAPTRIGEMNGDGNQDDVDNTFCLSWQEQVQKKRKNSQGEEEENHTFYAEAFPGVSHMEMVSDESVLEKIHEILFSDAIDI